MDFPLRKDFHSYCPTDRNICSHQYYTEIAAFFNRKRNPVIRVPFHQILLNVFNVVEDMLNVITVIQQCQ